MNMTLPKPPPLHLPIALRQVMSGLAALGLTACIAHLPLPCLAAETNSNTIATNATSTAQSQSSDATNGNPPKPISDTSLDSTNASPSSITTTNTPSNSTTGTTTNLYNNGLDFPSFRVVADRNIFNPNRSARSSRGGGRNTSSEPKPVRIESLSLVGTMSYGSNQLAFFDSSSSRYKKAVKLGDTIADHKLTALTSLGIRLEREGKNLELSVGGQLRREDDAPWELIAAAAKSSSTSSNKSSGTTASESGGANTNSTSASASAASGSNSAENEVLKRLLQKREQELNK